MGNDFEIPSASNDETARKRIAQLKEQRRKKRQKKLYDEYVIQGINRLEQSQHADSVSFLTIPATKPQLPVHQKDEAGKDITDEETKEAIARTHVLLKELTDAIESHNVPKLQAYLGPAVYQHQMTDNRIIYQLRWDWLAAREMVDLYAQAINFVVWFIRRHVCDTYRDSLRATLKKTKMARDVLKSKRNVIPKPGTFVENADSYAGGLSQQDYNIAYDKDTQKIEPLQKTVNDLESAWDSLTPYHRARQAYDRGGLLEYAYELTTTFSPQRLHKLFSHVDEQEVWVLSNEEREQLKNVVLKSLHDLPAIMSSKLNVLTRRSFRPTQEVLGAERNDRVEDDDAYEKQKTLPNAHEQAVSILSPLVVSVLGRVIQENAYKSPRLQQSVANKIQAIFNSTRDPVELLTQLHACWLDSVKKANDVEAAYCNFADASRRVDKEQACRVRHQAFVETLSGEDPPEADVMAHTQEFHVGAWNLSDAVSLQEVDDQQHWDLLAHAVRSYEERQHTRNTAEKTARLTIITELIRRGASIFTLPDYRDDLDAIPKESLIHPRNIPWPMLIATLETVVCITKLAETVRLTLLKYANHIHAAQDGKTWFNFYGRTCPEEFMRLTRLLEQSQHPDSFVEQPLVDHIKKYISESPRGWKNRSALALELQGIIERIEREELLIIPQSENVEMGTMNSDVSRASVKNSENQTVNRHALFRDQSEAGPSHDAEPSVSKTNFSRHT